MGNTKSDAQLEFMTAPETLTSLLRRHGLRTTKGLGQHFLADEAILQSIAAATNPSPSADIVEIGAGLGNLTYQLALSGANVTAIEIDRKFQPFHRDTFTGRQEIGDRVAFHYGDALKFDYPAAAEKAHAAGHRFLIVGNIPYQITSPLIMHILESGARFDSMTLMMQREVAERLAADPGSKRNGGISIKVQYFCDIETLMDVPREAFLPPPEVESQVLQFKLRNQSLSQQQTLLLFRLIDAAFAQRRKMLPNSVAASDIGYTRADIESSLHKMGKSVSVRAEQFGLDDFLALHAKLNET